MTTEGTAVPISRRMRAFIRDVPLQRVDYRMWTGSTPRPRISPELGGGQGSWAWVPVAAVVECP
jgi:hypothetical protein